MQREFNQGVNQLPISSVGVNQYPLSAKVVASEPTGVHNGCFEIDEYDEATATYQLKQPTEASLPTAQVLFTSAKGIEDERVPAGYCDPARWVAFDDTNGEPTVGDDVGTQASSYKLISGNTGFKCLAYNSTEELCLVRQSGSGGVGSLWRATADQTTGADPTVTIQPTDEDGVILGTGEVTLTVLPDSGFIKEDDWVNVYSLEGVSHAYKEWQEEVDNALVEPDTWDRSDDHPNYDGVLVPYIHDITIDFTGETFTMMKGAMVFDLRGQLKEILQGDGTSTGTVWPTGTIPPTPSVPPTPSGTAGACSHCTPDPARIILTLTDWEVDVFGNDYVCDGTYVLNVLTSGGSPCEWMSNQGDGGGGTFTGNAAFELAASRWLGIRMWVDGTESTIVLNYGTTHTCADGATLTKQLKTGCSDLFMNDGNNDGDNQINVTRPDALWSGFVDFRS